MLQIQVATAADYSTLAQIMFDAVRHGRSKYTPQQRQAWVPKVREGRAWNERLAAQQVFMAVDAGQVLGFMSLAKHGYIDFAYVKPASQGLGVFRALYQDLESYARKTGESRLWVHASLMAKKPFLAMGFDITKEELVAMAEESLKRFEMEKSLI